MKQLRGREVVYRLRVGEWRAAFVFQREMVLIVRVFHRSEGYDWLDE